MRHAENQAERLEWEAGVAIDYAIAPVEQAKLAVLDAPNGLHFNVNHGGVPAIDPSGHKLLIHGLVKRPLVFTVDALLRYPMVSRINFLECGGNSASLFSNQPRTGNRSADSRLRVMLGLDGHRQSVVAQPVPCQSSPRRQIPD